MIQNYLYMIQNDFDSKLLMIQNYSKFTRKKKRKCILDEYDN